MRNLFIITVLLCCLALPVLAAETPEATTKRVTNLENTTSVLRESQANIKLDLETTKDQLEASLAAEAQARKALEARLDTLAKALDAEIAARGQSDKMIAELQNELQNQRMRADLLQANLDKMKADQLAAAEALRLALDKNASQDKKDRTITYVMGVLLGGLAVAK